MKLLSDNLVMELVSFNEFYVRGVAYDRLTASFPSKLELRLVSGEKWEINSNHCSINVRLQEKLALPTDRALFFRLNMFDLANRLVPDYAIYSRDLNIWSFIQSKMDAELLSIPDAGKLSIREDGERKLIVVYSSAGTLDDIVRKILVWQPEFFKKEFNSGLSISLVEIGNVATDEHLSKADENTIIVIEDGLLHEFYKRLPNVSSRVEKFCVGRRPIEEYFGGLQNTVAHIMNINRDNGLLDFNNFTRLISCLSGYVDLFYAEQRKTYVYQSGVADEETAAVVRERIQGKETCDVALLVDEFLTSMADVNETNSPNISVFFNTSRMKNVLDIAAQDTKSFVRSALVRGLKIKQFVKET